MNKIKIKYGNLIKEKSDFIVNASNTELILGSGVSKAFRQHCGGSFFQQKIYTLKEEYIKYNGSIKQCDIIVSDSGYAKNFKYALHVAIMNYSDDTKTPYPSYSQIKQTLKNIVRVVSEIVKKDKIKKTKVTIPLLGTGTGGLKKEKVYLLIRSEFNKVQFDLETVIYLHSKKDFIKFFILDKKRKS